MSTSCIKWDLATPMHTYGDLESHLHYVDKLFDDTSKQKNQ